MAQWPVDVTSLDRGRAHVSGRGVHGREQDASCLAPGPHSFCNAFSFTRDRDRRRRPLHRGGVGCAGPPRRGLFGWVTIDEAAGIGRRRRAARVCMDGWNPRSRGRDRGATRVGGPKVLAEFPPTTWLTGSRLHQHARSPATVHPPAPHPTSPPLFCFVRCVGEVVCPVALRFLAEDHAVEIRSLQGIDSCLRFSNLAICWNYLSSPGCTFF